MSFNNKVILITGAASGMGAHTAQHLAKKGGQIALVDLNQKQLIEVSDQIKSAGSPTPLVIVADVTKDAERIIKETIDHFGQLNILINCAGIQALNTIENVDLDEFDRIMNVNVRSVIHLSKLAVSHLEKTKGNILNVSSAVGLRVRPNIFSYCVSKAAVNQVTKSAALDLAPKGIRVNAINPVVTKTAFIHYYGLTAQQEEEHFEKHKNAYPFGRVCDVTDISAAIEYLVGDSASFVTGSLFAIDGGAILAGH